MSFQLLIGSKDFWDTLQIEMESAQKRVYIQAMSVEGDRIGQQCFRTFEKSNAPDKRWIIDAYSIHILNDTFLHKPSSWLNKALQQEKRDTKAMLLACKDIGVEVTSTNPFKIFWWQYANRNHKKIVVVDDVAYIGGINFSEHNFSWHDVMLRIDKKEWSDTLAQDCLKTIAGINQSRKINIGQNQLFFISGKRSQNLYEDIWQLFRTAKHRIRVWSPYMTAPLLDQIIAAAENGVEVQIVSPEQNNKPYLKDYLIRKVQGITNISLYFIPGVMSHAKIFLIDDEQVLMGSSNFDFVSYYVGQEVVGVFRDKSLVDTCLNHLFKPALVNHSKNFHWKQSSYFTRVYLDFLMNWLSKLF